MSDQIIGRIDEMGSRIDELESSIGELMAQVRGRCGDRRARPIRCNVRPFLSRCVHRRAPLVVCAQAGVEEAASAEQAEGALAAENSLK